MWGNYTTFTDTAADARNRVLFSLSATHFDEVAEIPHSDRNLKLVSLASVGWDLTSGVLSWDAPLNFDNPWTTGYSQIAIGNAVLSTDGDRLYIDLARDATGTTVVGTTVRAKASAATDRYTKNRVFVALRDQGVIYLFDGTRIEDGQTVQIGSTPPPNGSITYQKYSTATGGNADADALLFLNKFFRDYVMEDETDYWTPDIIERNTSLATITYATSTGIITYTGTMDLSEAETLFNAGVPLYIILRNMDIIANPVHNLEPILGVNDSAGTVTIAKGMGALGLGAAHIWNGAIGKNGMVVTNDDLDQFEYDPDGVNPGRISGPGATNLRWKFSQEQVFDGCVFVDSSGKEYPIIDRDVSGNGDWLTIPPGLRDVDDSVPTTKYQGSIKTAHNPLGINLSDAKCLYGQEFVPVDYHGPREEKYSESIIRGWSTLGFGEDITNLECRTIRPYDKRVHLWVEPLQRNDGNGEINRATNATFDYGEANVRFVQISAVCTGVALVVSRGVDSGIQNYGANLDGRLGVGNVFFGSVDSDNLYGVVQGRYEVVTIPNLMRLYQGPHDVWIEVDPETKIRGVILVNHNIGTYSGHVLECPGTVVKKAGVVVKSLPSMAEIPAAPTYDKGRRLVRYLNSSGTLAWASSEVKSISESVDINSNPTVSNVNTDNWRIGDIIMFINPTTQRRWMHRVTAKGVGTLTITPAAGFTATTTAYYYGHGFQAYTEATAMLVREFEEAVFHANMAEFAAGPNLSDNRSCIGRPAVRHTNNITVRMNDAAHGVVGSGTANTPTVEAGGGVDLTILGDTIRIWFVGTGLSIMRNTTNGTVDVTVDGVVLPALDLSTSAADHDTDDGGTYICGDAGCYHNGCI
jgi:hypothetical protein